MNNNIFKWVILALNIAFLAYLSTRDFQCNGGQTQSDTVIVKEYDSVPVQATTSPGKKFYPVFITDTFYKPHTDTVFIDTSAIIKAWLLSANYAVQEYRDSGLYLNIQDTIYQNKISWRHIEYKLLRPVNVATIINTPKAKSKIFLGVDFIYSQTGGIAPGINFIPASERYLYSIKSNVLQPQPNFSAGIYWRVK